MTTPTGSAPSLIPNSGGEPDVASNSQPDAISVGGPDVVSTTSPEGATPPSAAESPLETTSSTPVLTVSTTAEEDQEAHDHGTAFDIRTFISVALGLIGVFLVVCGLVFDPEYNKTGNINANLITGIALIVVSIIFIVWAKIAPLAPPADVTTDAPTVGSTGNTPS
jgi:hypothetical protein